MKELSIEEKAKRYDEAIERAKAWYKLDNNDLSNDDLETLFPEIRESKDERIRKDIIVLVKDWWDRVNKDNISTKEQMIAWLEKQGEQKPQRMISAEAKEAMYNKPAEWSEDDEVKINRIVDCLENLNVADNDILLKDVDWLKSLKDRVQPQPNQEWSEEDEKIAKTIINEFEQSSEWYCANGLTKEDCIAWVNKQMHTKWSEEDKKKVNNLYVLLDQMVSFNMLSNKDATEFKDWLKSLRPQNRWKPSKEQMEALAWALSLAKNCGEECAFDLRTLQDQLKKLTEE